ncbi:MAG: ABC transporter ATP-binding protein/permease [Tissierellaceae bacterium]|nr:ABC transporter ATP-binding protein/permease [Tissierellaceae bacterium]
MLKLFKEFKPFTILIFLIVGLLLLQASTELALPDYMSRIVNIGIQQNGIEDPVPEAIRVWQMEKIKSLLTNNERVFVEYNYRLVDKNSIDIKEYERLVKKYPVLENESLFILDTKDSIEELGEVLAKPMVILWGMENQEILPMEQKESLQSKLGEGFANLPEQMISQGAINFVRAEYEAIGMNTRKIQSNYILYIGGIMLLISILSAVASISVGFLSSRVSARLGRNLRDKVFRKVTSFSNSEFDDFSTASLITRSTNDIQQVQMFTMLMLRMVFYAPILGVGGIIRALRTNTSMAWTIGVGVMAILALVLLLFSIAMPRFKKMQKLVDKVNLVMRESLNGLMVIRAFNTQKYEEGKFDKANRDLTKTNLFVSRMMVMMMPTMMLIMNGIMLLIIWVGAREIDMGSIQVGDMMAFMQYTMQIIMSFLMISMVSIMLPRASVSASRISEVLDKELSIEDPMEAKTIVEKSPGKLEFNNVYFKYPGAEKHVLEGISFAAKPGEITAFIGSTGSGKSTIINLIPRFYDVTEGEILLDGINIKDLKLQDLRERIGYVPQKGILFSGTIDSNLRYGKNINAKEEDILKAIEISQAKEFIEEKEKGIQSEISQGGSNVSGGQKQRLSIARALVKRPDIFIFDDSFSALDFKTDANLRKAMEKDIQNSTIIIVAQRINTIANAENIIVLDEGKIVGMGKHKELLRSCQVYRQIALSQLSEEELAI